MKDLVWRAGKLSIDGALTCSIPTLLFFHHMAHEVEEEDEAERARRKALGI